MQKLSENNTTELDDTFSNNVSFEAESSSKIACPTSDFFSTPAVECGTTMLSFERKKERTEILNPGTCEVADTALS